MIQVQQVYFDLPIPAFLKKINAHVHLMLLIEKSQLKSYWFRCILILIICLGYAKLSFFMANVCILFVQCNIFREQQKHKLPCLLHEAPRGLRFIDDKKNPTRSSYQPIFNKNDFIAYLRRFVIDLKVTILHLCAQFGCNTTF